MSLIPPLLGAAVFLSGLTLATNYRGAARWVVEVLLNPAYAEPRVVNPGLLGVLDRGVDRLVLPSRVHAATNNR